MNILILGVGMFWAVDGVRRGFLFGGLDKTSPDQLVVSYLTNPGGRRLFPSYTACGTVRRTGEFVMVDVFQDQFRRLEPGSTLDVYPVLVSGQTNWVNAAKHDESKPIFNVLGFQFSWHLPAGLLMAAYGGLCLAVRAGVLRHRKV